MVARILLLRASTGSPATWSECSCVMRMASRRSNTRSGSSPMAASRLPSSLMLRPASTRTHVFSVASRAAFPELPLASTQNLTIAASPDSSEYTKRRRADPRYLFRGGFRGGQTTKCDGLSHWLLPPVGHDDGGVAHSAGRHNRQAALVALIGRDHRAAFAVRSGNVDNHGHVFALPFVESQHLRRRIRGGKSEFAAFASAMPVAARSLDRKSTRLNSSH